MELNISAEHNTSVNCTKTSVSLPVSGLTHANDRVINNCPAPRTLSAAARQAAHLGLSHMFRDKRVDELRVFSSFDPATETVRPDSAGLFLDRNERVPEEVGRVLLLGSNFELFSDSLREQFRDFSSVGKLGDMLVRATPGPVDIVGPKDSELLAFASTLRAKKILDRNGIPSTTLYMPSDLAKGLVHDARLIRDLYIRNRQIDDYMRILLQEYEFGNMPCYSNPEIFGDKSQGIQANAEYAGLVRAGKAIWYALESEYRRHASRLLELIVKDGIEAAVEKYNPHGLGEWRKENEDKKDKWRVMLERGIYYLLYTRRKKQALPIPIGVEMLLSGNKTAVGAPKCPLIASEFLMRAQRDFEFTHMLAAFHSTEVPVASGGFFIARRIFGVGIQIYTIKINADTLDIEDSTRNGAGAFLGRFYDPNDLDPIDLLGPER
jgi:hypothetical protein